MVEYNQIEIFNLSSSVMAMGVVIAVYSLRTLEWRITLSIRPWWIRNFWWILSFLGIAFSIVAFSLKNNNFFWLGIYLTISLLLFVKYINKVTFRKSLFIRIAIKNFLRSNFFWCLFLVGLAGFVLLKEDYLPLKAIKEGLMTYCYNPSTWQMMSAFCFIFAPIAFIYPSISTKGLFGKNQTERFFTVALSCATNSNIEVLKYITNILTDNLHLVFEKLKRNSDREEQENARSVLEVVLTESNLLDYIVEHRIDFLQEFFYQIKKNKIPSSYLRILHDKLFFHLYANQESYLYKHVKYGGEGLVINIFEIIYEDETIVECYNPFPDDLDIAVYTKEDFSHLKFFEVLNKALCLAIEQLWSKGVNYSDGIAEGLQSVRLAFTSIDYSKIVQNDSSLLHDINLFLGMHLPDLLKKYNDKIRIDSSKIKLDDYVTFSPCNRDMPITEMYSNLYLGFLENLSRIQDETFDYRALVLGSSIFFFDRDGDDFSEIRSILVAKIWHFIENTNLKGYYGALIKVYFSIIVWKPQSTSSQWYIDEYNKAVNCLYDVLKPKFSNGDKMSNGVLMEKVLLPSIIEFDHKIGKFLLVGRPSFGKEYKSVIELFMKKTNPMEIINYA